METGSCNVTALRPAATPRQDLGNLVDVTYPMLSLLGPGLLKSSIQRLDSRANLLGKETLLNNQKILMLHSVRLIYRM